MTTIDHPGRGDCGVDVHSEIHNIHDHLNQALPDPVIPWSPERHERFRIGIHHDERTPVERDRFPGSSRDGSLGSRCKWRISLLNRMPVSPATIPEPNSEPRVCVSATMFPSESTTL